MYSGLCSVSILHGLSVDFNIFDHSLPLKTVGSCGFDSELSSLLWTAPCLTIVFSHFPKCACSVIPISRISALFLLLWGLSIFWASTFLCGLG